MPKERKKRGYHAMTVCQLRAIAKNRNLRIMKKTKPGEKRSRGYKTKASLIRTLKSQRTAGSHRPTYTKKMKREEDVYEKILHYSKPRAPRRTRVRNVGDHVSRMTSHPSFRY